MKLLKGTAFVAAALLLAGCATEMAWQRADGGPVVGWEFERATDKCRRKALYHGEDAVSIMQRCMARHGYVWGASYGYNDYDDYEYRRHRRHRRYGRYDD